MSAQDPELIILPGIDGNPELRSGIVSALRNRFRVRVERLPDEPQLDYEGLSRWFADRLPERPVIIAGESFSGPLAALLAARCPDRVLGVAFVATFTKLLIPKSVGEVLRFVPIRALPRGPIDWLVNGRNGSVEVAAAVKKILANTPEAIIKHRVRLALGIDVQDVVRRLPQPILVVHGKSDRLVPRLHVRSFVKARPDARVVVIDGPHMIVESHPRQVAQVLAEFITDLMSARVGSARAATSLERLL